MDTKGRILKILSQNRAYMSGEAISRGLGISRSAVSLAVKGLRDDGYVIESVTNRGYRLLTSPDLLTAAAVGVYLSEERMELVDVFPVIDSTSSELMRRSTKDIEDRSVIIADRQTKGRGRRGRSFDSPSGKGVYLSYYFKPDDNLRAEIEKRESPLIWAGITSCTAVAVSDAIEKVCKKRPGIKWVNDLFMNGRKLCGILTQLNTSAENNEAESIIIGIGINAAQEYGDFPDDIRDTAGSIYTETGQKIKRAELAAAVIDSLDSLRATWPYSIRSYHKKYIDNCIVLGKSIVLSSPSGTKEAVAKDVDEDFALVAAFPDGSINRIISGDVTLRVVTIQPSG